MYINNSRESDKFKNCSPLQFHCNLKDLSFAVGYYSCTHRCRMQVIHQKKEGNTWGIYIYDIPLRY